MDDSVSDEINIVSSDDDDDNVREVVELEDEHVDAVTESDDNHNDDVRAVVLDTADATDRTVVGNDNLELDDSDENAVELVSVGGIASDHGQESPGSDEVVVVDNVLVEESDLNETSDEEERATVDEGNEPVRAPIFASPQGNPSTQSQHQSQPQNHGQNQPEDANHPAASDFARSSVENETSYEVSVAVLPLPGTSRSIESEGGDASIHGHLFPNVRNTIVDNFLGVSPVQEQAAPVLPLPSWPSINESFQEFRSPKRRRVLSPEKPAVKGDGKSNLPDDEEDDEDGNSCSICFEPWDNSGKHRLASLKCGHLFGLSCIEKWLKGQGGKCPSCNVKAKMKDIRVIYAKAIKMIDTTERDRALRELDQEKELCRHAELEAAQARLQCQQCMDESRRLREEVTRLQGELSAVRSYRDGAGSSMSQLQSSQSKQLQGRFIHDKTVKIWEGGQCRVMAHCPSLAALVISQPSGNLLFPGYGIKKLSCLDFKTSSYMTLHQKALRAMSFHPNIDDGILLSVSMDKTVRLTSVITNVIVQTYTMTLPLWSCEWNADNQNYFYVGQQNGRVLEFDTRNLGTNVNELNVEGSKSPVVALQYMSRDVNAAFKPGGLIVGQLDRVSFFETKGDNQHRLHILPLEGNLTSLNVDPQTRHMLASFRPTAKHPTVRHQLCELTSTNALGDTVISCNGVHTFHGGRSQSVLGRTMLLPHPADNSRLLVVAGDEQSESAHLWDTGTSQLVQRLPCQGAPVDFTAFSHNSTFHLAALTDKCLKLHRWS